MTWRRFELLGSAHHQRRDNCAIRLVLARQLSYARDTESAGSRKQEDIRIKGIDKEMAP